MGRTTLMEIETNKRIRKYGNSYVVTIPAAYVNDGLLKEGERVLIRITRTTQLEPNLDPSCSERDFVPGFQYFSFLGQISQLQGHHVPENPDCPCHTVPLLSCGWCSPEEPFESISVTI